MSQYRTLVNMGADRLGSLAAQQLAERVNTMQSVRCAARPCQPRFGNLLLHVFSPLNNGQAMNPNLNPTLSLASTRAPKGSMLARRQTAATLWSFNDHIF